MAFDDLDQAEQEEAQQDATDMDASAGSTTEPDEMPHEPDAERDTDRLDRAQTGGSTVDDTRSASGSVSADANAPAFGFEEAKQRPLYARQSAWDEFEDALAIDVETTLRRNDVRDAPKRELHDAALRVLADHADEVADRVLQERGVDR
ncbi:hypothetical protein [Halobaculum limi]|uniref:hypothetical protein n=1 Tax=Halobaculum limi TaxID=3031916 RepID=UPI0024058779|nr:hypothetical protein [Halobaculum sp. YSMS11]